MRTHVAAAALLVCTLSAADSSVGGPALGWARFGNSVYPLLGIPGAARMAEPIASGVSLAAVAPGAAIVCIDGKLDRFDGTQPAVRIAGDCPGSIALSPSGSAAVLVDAGRLRIVRGDSTQTLPVAAERCAINDSGDLLLCRTRGGLLRIDAPSGAETTVLDEATAVEFLPGSSDAVAADAARLYLLRNASEPIPIASFEGAVAVMSIASGDTVVAVSQAHRRFLIARVDGSASEVGDLPFDPHSLQRLTDANAVLVEGPPGSAPWLLVRGAEAARVWFVPRPEGVHE